MAQSTAVTFVAVPPTELQWLTEARAGGFQLAQPLFVRVQWDGALYLVSTALFDTYGVGQDADGAIADFVSNMAAEYAWLLDHSDALSPNLASKLEALGAYLRIAEE